MACITTLIVLVNVDNGSSFTEDKFLLLKFFLPCMVFSVQCVQTESVGCVCICIWLCLYAITYICMYSSTVQLGELVHIPGQYTLLVSTHSWSVHTPG